MPIRPTARPVAATPPGVAGFAGRRLHLLGIGGCGMSGLARMLQELGAECSGRDLAETPVTRELVAAGIPVAPDAPGEPMPSPAPDGIIASAAVPADHPILVAAAAAGIPRHGYAEALGLVQASRTGVSVAGTHGKSTTTAMLCHVLIEAGLDPGFIVGARCPQIGGGSRPGAARVPSGPYAGRPGLLVAEACEFQRSFHRHHPVIGAVLNVEEDHLDIYGTLDAIVEAFAGFAARLPAAADGGALLVAHDGAHRRRVAATTAARVRTFGFAPDADHRVERLPGGTVAVHGVGPAGPDAAPPAAVCRFQPPMPGDHNILDAAAAAILAGWLGADADTVGPALAGFAGLDRRMSRLGTRRLSGGGEAIVYDDYGHHPTEIDATLRALRTAESPSRVVCVFQPHQHSRTRFLLDEFMRAFEAADVVIVPEIHFVRDSEAERQRITAGHLVDGLRARGVVAMHLHPFEAIVEQLDVLLRPGDLLVVMGAGPVGRIAHAVMERSAATAASAVPTAAGAEAC